MTASLSCRFNFEAAHWSPWYPKDHPNGRMHGHSYAVEIVVEREPDECGRVIEAGVLVTLAETLRRFVDHRVLNEVEGLAHPTMEALARFFLDRARTHTPEVSRVIVERPTIGLRAEAW